MHEITKSTAVEGGWGIPVAEMRLRRSLRRFISILFWRYLLAVLHSPLNVYSRSAILIFPSSPSTFLSSKKKNILRGRLDF